MSKLEKYMQERALPTGLPRHIDHYINIPRSELTLMGPEALAEMAYEIYSYTYYLQTVNNQQVAKAEKCKAEIERIVAPRWDDYRHIYGREEKMLVAISDDQDATDWKEIEVNARAAATRTSYLTQRLENMAKCLLELQNTKRR